MQKQGSVIVSPDKSEPRPSGSGNPLANARGSVGLGETMTEAYFSKVRQTNITCDKIMRRLELTDLI